MGITPLPNKQAKFIALFEQLSERDQEVHLGMMQDTVDYWRAKSASFTRLVLVGSSIVNRDNQGR